MPVPELTSIQLSLSDSNPLYSESVSLTVTPEPVGAAFPSGSAVSFYIDPDALYENPQLFPNGILLNINGPIKPSNGKAVLKEKFLGGQHRVEAILKDAVGHEFVSQRVLINVISAVAVPTTGAYLGAATTNADIDSAEKPLPIGVGRPYSINIQYADNQGNPWTWIADENPIKNGKVQWNKPLADDIQHGRIPLISWGCDGSVSGSDGLIADADDSHGDITTIKQTAAVLSQYPGPVMLRWKWEFNGFWAHHALCDGEAPTTKVWQQTAINEFIGAWQRIWATFQQQQVTNIVFDWNPNYYATENDATNAKPFYPGDAFVDWIGVDTYQGDHASDVTRTFKDDMEPWYDDFTGHDKPMIVGENGAPQYSLVKPPQEVQWPYINGAYADFREGDFPLVHAYDWFDEQNSLLDNNNGHGKGGLDAMANLGASSYFTSTSLIASSELPSTLEPSSDYSPTLVITNDGLLPILDAQVISITDVSVISGKGTVTPPGGSFNLPTLTAGQATTLTPHFRWPESATCVRMTINYAARNASFTGSNTIEVARIPAFRCP